VNQLNSTEEASIVGFDSKDQTDVPDLLLTVVAALVSLELEDMTEYGLT